MANWGEIFADAYSTAYNKGAERKFEKWKMENDGNFNNIIQSGKFADAIMKLTEAGIIPPNVSSGVSNTLPNSISQVSNGISNIMGIAPDVNLPISPKGLNVMGVPTGYEIDKEKVKDIESRKEDIEKTGNFVEQFGRSYNELKSSYPNIGDVGFGGLISRISAKVGTKLDQYPETQAFLRELLPLANKMARTIEGGRVTDQDRKVYADSLANTVSNPSSTNIRLVSNKLRQLKDKGGDITDVMRQLKESDIDVLQKIYIQTEYPNYNPEKDKIQYNKKTKDFRIIKR
jgi:hypothetical protein